MSTRAITNRENRARSWGRFTIAVSIGLLAILMSGCATYSPVSGLPSSNADKPGRCPLGQARVCHVGWPSRLDGGNRNRSCRCR